MNPDLREFYRLAQRESRRAENVKAAVYLAAYICAMTLMVWFIGRA